MNNEEVSKLEKIVEMHGFGQNMISALREQIEKGATNFQIPQQGKMDEQDYSVVAHFHKGRNEKVYFNFYDLFLKSDKSPGGLFTQSFDIRYKEDFTLREAFNLMNNRAVSKELLDNEGKVHKPWVKMDFTSKNENGIHPIKVVRQPGEFDLEKELENYPIRNWQFANIKDELIRSLERGNLQPVSIEQNKKDQLFYISANPDFKGIEVFDKSGAPFPAHQLMKSAQQVFQSEEKKEDRKESVSHGQATTPKGDEEVVKKKISRK